MKKDTIRKVFLGVLVVGIIATAVFLAVRPQKNTDTPNTEPITTVETPKPAESVSDTSAEVLPQKDLSSKKTTFNALLKSGTDEFVNKNYDKAIDYYNQALSIPGMAYDVVYIRLFSAYNQQNNIDKARVAIENTIKARPDLAEYWNTKINFLDEKTDISFADLAQIYADAFVKVNSQTKLDLVTFFARVAEGNHEYARATIQWEKAIELNPSSKNMYQAEIDALK